VENKVKNKIENKAFIFQFFDFLKYESGKLMILFKKWGVF